MPSLIGQSLGRYQILEQLGEGGMSTVYKAYDSRLERNVAIKVIRTDQFAPSMLDEMLKRFEREAKALARLSHPNIVHVHDYGEFEGAPFLVMEYVASGTLKERPDKPVPWKEAVRIILPVAHALAYAHGQHVIHRDIKPGNILLTEISQPMLSDFGIAKIVGSNEGATLTGAGASIGTPEYMAPEQWTGESSPQCDIYSLGVVLYELVTGRKPYTADTPVGVMLKQVNEPLPRPTQFVPDLPLDLETILVRAMEKRPEDRFQSMDEFVTALENLNQEGNLAPAKKIDSFPTGKTLLATGPEAGQVFSGGGTPPEGPATLETPAESGGAQPIPTTRRARWIPLGGLAILLCIGVIAATVFALRGLTSTNQKPTDAAGLPGVPTQLVSQNQLTPHAEIKVLWDISHGPRTGTGGTTYTPDGLYQALAQSLKNDRFTITSGDLSNLDSYDILVIAETSGTTPYTTSEVDQIEQYVRTGGHGLLVLSDTPDLENLADIVSRRFSIGLGELNSDGPTKNSDEPFFAGVSSIKFVNGGGILQVSSPATSASVDTAGNSVIAFCQCDAGREMTIGDTNLWDNQGLTQADNQRFATNVFEWLAKLSP